jgi:hypothetical protein
MDVDQEIDELLSDTEAPPASSPPRRQEDEDDSDLTCHWDDCEKELPSVNALAKHLDEGESTGPEGAVRTQLTT